MLLALLILQGIVFVLMVVVLLHRAPDRLARSIDGTAWAGSILGAVVLAAVYGIVLKLFPYCPVGQTAGRRAGIPGK